MEKSQSTPLFQDILSFHTRFFETLFKEVAEWPSWWNHLSLFKKIFPAFAIVTYWLALAALNGLRGDHFVIGCSILVLSYAGRAARNFLGFALPFFLTGIVYDSQRFYSDMIRGPIHVAEPYNFDKSFFGISTPQGILTPNEWWQLHVHPALDLVTGFAYLTFVAVFIGISGYFAFFLKKKEALQMPWAFFWLNVLGYSTYYWYAAAPPWYVALYGTGPARMDVGASSAGCARFDLILGTHFFSEMYGRAADVFGAIPSLHVSYPLLAVFFAFHFKRARSFSICFYLLMCFSAVYLNHHYILDILWGSSYALLIGWMSLRLFQVRNTPAPLQTR